MCRAADIVHEVCRDSSHRHNHIGFFFYTLFLIFFHLQDLFLVSI